MIYETVPSNTIPKNPDEVMKDILETFSLEQNNEDIVIGILRKNDEGEDINEELKDLALRNYLEEHGIKVNAPKKRNMFVVRITEELRAELNE